MDTEDIDMDNVIALFKTTGIKMSDKNWQRIVDISFVTADLAYKLGVKREREECAKLVDDLVLEHPGRADLTAQQFAAAIRARGEDV